MSLNQVIRSLIHEQGSLPFVQFMQQALYHPDFGYYSARLQSFGVGGDFITAPELTPLFGQTLANQCRPILENLQNPIVFEFGAGSGRLCVDILKHLDKVKCPVHEYHILEVSGQLIDAQRALIAVELPHWLDKIKWHRSWPRHAFEGVVIANEVLDAMPVHRFIQTVNGLLESHVAINADGELCEIGMPCQDQRLISHVETILPVDTPLPYQSEANLFIADWIQSCYTLLDRGVVFLIDYGFPQHEYYHPDRRTGTLMCHYQHRAHTNPLLHLGEQDITAHVNFTHVAEMAYTAGFHVAGFTNQASFLLANGLLNLLSVHADLPTDINRQQATKQLLNPNEMGELFKVLALTKHWDIPLQGFQLHDKRANL